MYAEDPTVITGALCGGFEDNDVLELNTMPDADGMRLAEVLETVVRTETGATIGETALCPGTTTNTKPFTSVVMEDAVLDSVWIGIALLSRWRELEGYPATFVLPPLTYTTVATELVSGTLASSLGWTSPAVLCFIG